MRKLTQINHIDALETPVDFIVVGTSHKHESADKQVCGEALFVDDHRTPEGTLHGAVILSDITKGEILSMDFSEVKSASGVVKIIGFDNIPGETDIGPIFKGDPLLSDSNIKFHKQPVALVLANNYRQAWQAAKKAVIEYQQTDTCVSFNRASKEPHLLPENQFGKTNTLEELKTSDIYLEAELSIGGQEHFYLEGQISLAEPTEDGGIFIRSSTQHPAEVQKLIAEVLNIPFNKVTVDTRRMGGAFGGKESQAAQWACLAALGAHLSHKAVKIRLPRTVDMSVTGKRHPFRNKYQIAATREGVIERASIELNALCGHSADLSGAIVDRAMFHSDNAYFLRNASVIGHCLKTDTVTNTAFRGFGAPQGVIGIEKIMQDLSIKTNLDALDIRLKNLYRDENNLTPYGMEVEQTDTLLSVIQQLEKSAGYRERRETIKQWNRSNTVLKKGLALTPVKFGISFTAKHLNQAGALVHVYTDGSVQVSHGGTEMGQGLHTKIQQIVAQTLGIPAKLVLVTSTRTDKVPNASATAASSGADLNGMAAHNAATEIKARLLKFASDKLGFDKEPGIANGKVTANDRCIDWTELVQKAYLARISLSQNGFYKTPKIWFDTEKSCGRPFFYFSIGASCSEVTIDTLTGEMRVDRADILHDVGNSLNPAIDIGQIEGAFIQGMGWLTSEELLWDRDGKLLSDSPMNYKIPTVSDYPKQMNISLYDKANPEHSIYRSKAIGEPPFLHAISVWCAVYDAVASISRYKVIPKLNAPATGEQILNACINQFISIGYTSEDTKDSADE